MATDINAPKAGRIMVIEELRGHLRLTKEMPNTQPGQAGTKNVKKLDGI